MEADERIEEMAAVARVARALRVLLGHVLASYAFFAYGLGVIGSALTLGPLLARAGIDQGVAMSAGALAGIVLASALFARVRVLAEQPSPRRSPATVLALLAPFAIAPLAVWLISPDRVQISWLPSLGAFLTVLYLVEKAPELRHHLYAGLALLALSPPVLLLNDPALAMGVTSLVYLVAGARSLEEGLRRAGPG